MSGYMRNTSRIHAEYTEYNSTKKQAQETLDAFGIHQNTLEYTFSMEYIEIHQNTRRIHEDTFR